MEQWTPEGWGEAGNCKGCSRRSIRAHRRKGIREKDESGKAIMN